MIDRIIIIAKPDTLSAQIYRAFADAGLMPLTEYISLASPPGASDPHGAVLMTPLCASAPHESDRGMSLPARMADRHHAGPYSGAMPGSPADASAINLHNVQRSEWGRVLPFPLRAAVRRRT